MGLFKRKRPELPRDEALTFMTETQATALRSLVREVFAESGREVVVYADHVVDDSGGQFGLWNLAALCAPEPQSRWRHLIEEHVRRITAAQPDFDELSDDEFRSSLYLRLVEANSLPDRTFYPYARDIGEHLVELLSVDMPEMITTPPEEALIRRGDIHSLKQAGLDNLRSVLDQPDVEVQTIEALGSGRFAVATGESFLTASLSLILPEAIARFTDERDAGKGVLVVIPFRHQLAYRVIDGDDCAAALNNLFKWAMLGFGDAPGPLSPHVYWVRDGHWTQITRFDEEGRPCVDVSEELALALDLTDEEPG
ncbi:MAG TPA: hypothetical protein VLI04_22640 [Nocardioidaceae bacterium]|nr:hypothetical protein [Nocardioidaceae bacterium]